MAETCIVCLGDLDANESDPPQLQSTVDDALTRDGPRHITTRAKGLHKHSATGSSSSSDDDLIARLLPCGHILHNDCLKPWVERANSCPICRASFNMVELSKTLSGTVLSSYDVQDKRQVADIDPTMFLEEPEDEYEPFLDPCMLCEEVGDQDQLQICAGCDGSCHYFCAGLDGIPSGLWFCPTCMENPRVMADARQRSLNNRAGRRGRQNLVTSTSAREWARVWRSVWNRLNFDLDFPDEAVLDRRRNSTERREFDEWERRFQVAQRQGAGTRFRQSAAIIESQALTDKSGDVEGQREIRAWNAFEKAREAQDEPPASNRRKRKSSTSSAADPPPEPERKLKRPRTRRTVEVTTTTDGPSEPAPLPSSSRRPSDPEVQDRRSSNVINTGNGPTFLQSLLKEVEVSATPEDGQPPKLIPIVERASSPRPSSPGNSPTSSNYPTPGIMTPPPFSLSRPSSPPPLTSNVAPVYGPAPVFPPFSPADEDNADRKGRKQRPSRPHLSPLSSPIRSKDASPSRPNISYSTKAEIQKMVKAVLKPLYAKQEVTKDEYTDINRDVSRMLYDKVGDASGLAEATTREKWQKFATTEVENAIKARRSNEVTAASS